MCNAGRRISSVDKNQATSRRGLTSASSQEDLPRKGKWILDNI